MTEGRQVQDFIKSQQKTAREAFEELDYQLVRDDKHFLKYERNWDNVKFVVVFDKYLESYTSYEKANSRFFIDAELNKVIQHQLRELGWL